MNSTSSSLSSPSSKLEKYLFNQVVIVVSEYQWFGLVKVRYKEDTAEFLVDAKLLSVKPDSTHTINLSLLGGTHHDS